MNDLTKFENYTATFVKVGKKNDKKVIRKGKSCPSSSTKKNTPMKRELEEDITFFELLELYFEEDTTLKVLIPAVKDMIDLAKTKVDLEMKRTWMRIMEKVERMIQIVLTKNRSKTLPWNVFKKSLQEEKSVMRSLNDILVWGEERESFVQFLKDHATKLSSCNRASASMEHARTMSEIKHIETKYRSVERSKKFREDEPSTSSIESETSNAKVISQFISRRGNRESHTVRTSGQEDTNLIRIEILPVQAIQGKEEKDWSQYASVRCNFLTRSSNDPLHVQVCRTLGEVEKRLSQREISASRKIPDFIPTVSFLDL